MIFKNFKDNTHEGSYMDLEDLMNVKLINDNLRAFQNTWNTTLAILPESERPNLSTLLTLYRRQLEEDGEIKTKAFMERYRKWKTDCQDGADERTYERLHYLVDQHLAQRQ